MLIVVGSTNEAKINAVAAAAHQLGLDARICGVKVDSGIAEQPFDSETWRGARNRALHARQIIPNGDLYVSIENGLFPLGDKFLDRAVVVACAKDRSEFSSVSVPVEFDAHFVAIARQRGFATTTVGRVLQEYGVVKDHADPHLDLIGKSRLSLLQEAVMSVLLQYQTYDKGFLGAFAKEAARATTRDNLSQTQRQALDDALNVLRQAFPGQSDVDIVSQHFLPRLLGPLPTYSNLSGYAMNATRLTAVAANVVCHGIDPKTHEPFVVLISRKESNQYGEHYKGLIGGYVNLDGQQTALAQLSIARQGEQPIEGAVREMDEETRDADNQAVLSLSTDRLELLTGGINYKVEPPVAYFSYTARLEESEIVQLKKHIELFSNDGVYKTRTLKNNDYEIFGIHIVPLSQAREISEQAFLYPAAWNTFCTALNKLESAYRLAPSGPTTRQTGFLCRHEQ